MKVDFRIVAKHKVDGWEGMTCEERRECLLDINSHKIRVEVISYWWAWSYKGIVIFNFCELDFKYLISKLTGYLFL
jgi:hypothetical protein